MTTSATLEPTPPAPTAVAQRPTGRQANLWRALLRSPTTLLGLIILTLHLLLALISPWLVPYSPTALDPANLFGAPSWAHPFGADQYGRDILMRVLLGGRLALLVSFSASLLAVLLAVLVGGLLGI